MSQRRLAPDSTTCAPSNAAAHCTPRRLDADALRCDRRSSYHSPETFSRQALLERRVRIAIAKAGLDPSIGYLHVCQSGRQALVCDLMEPYRPRVDREVLAFIQSQTFTPRDFAVDAKVACRLHPELAKGRSGPVRVVKFSRVVLGDSRELSERRLDSY